MSEGVAETETPEEVEGRIRQLLAKASYKYGKECSILRDLLGVEFTFGKLYTCF